MNRAFDIDPQHSFYETKLINSKAEELFKIYHDIYIRVDQFGDILEFVASSADNSCIIPENIIGEKFEEILPEKIRSTFKKACYKAVGSNSQVHFEYSLYYFTQLKNFTARLIPSLNNNIIITINETAKLNDNGQKQSKLTEKLLADIVDSSHDAIIGNSLNGIIASWNNGAEKIFGYSKDEVEGFSFSFLFSPERSDEIETVMKRIRNGEKIDNYETVCITKVGIPIDISATVSPIKDSSGLITGVSVIARDITEKKLMEKTLRESEERNRSIIETSPDAVLLIDVEGKIMMGNRLFVEMFGFETLDEILGRNIFDFILTGDRYKLLHDAKRVLDSGRLQNVEYNLKNKNGTLFPAEISASLVVDSLGIPDAIIAIVRNISERKIAEEALKNSEMQFRSVWENSNDGMRLTDENGIIVAVNNAFCKMIEFKKSDLIGKTFNSFYLKKEPDYLEESLRVYKKNFQERSFSTYKQSKSTFHNKKTVELNVTYSMIEFEKGKPLLLAIFHDVTENKRVEQELRESEKHAAIGKMTAYLSHEIKTPLASIKMNIDMLSKSLEIPADKQKSFFIIQKEVKRLNNLLKNVLQFSRRVDLVSVNINFSNLINNIKVFIEPTLVEKNIFFINKIQPVIINGDYQKLHSVLLHLIENSIDAISSDGIIEISSKIDKQVNRLSVYVKDSGCGIKIPGQIFDPFFTTKASGTGLGLSIAQKIIEQHNGKIQLLSSTKGETIFELIFNNFKTINGYNTNN